jgi:hypothetical protein
MKIIFATTVAMLCVSVAAPASAVVVTFASFSPVSSTRNIRYIANTGASRVNDGRLITATGSTTVATPMDMRFSFILDGADPQLFNVLTSFTLDAVLPRGHTMPLSGAFDISGFTGTFSFLTKQALTINGETYAAGSNLLSGQFGGANIAGVVASSSGSVFAATEGGDSLTFTSDFVYFRDMYNADFSFALTSVNPLFSRSGIGTLGSFRSVISGQFSADPPPRTVVPEPETWAMLVLGFGLVGVAARRRRQTVLA